MASGVVSKEEVEVGEAHMGGEERGERWVGVLGEVTRECTERERLPGRRRWRGSIVVILGG